MIDSSTAATCPSTFRQKSDGFVEWFTTREGTRLSHSVQLADLRSRDAGRGVVAIQDIGQDEELFAIPASAVLTAANSGLPQDVLFEASRDDTWLQLMVAIIYERLRNESSPWHPYFEVLPTTFNTLMFWADEELTHLQASAVLKKIGRKEAEQAWESSILPVMLKYPELFPVSGEDGKDKKEVLTGLAHFAGSLIMAYAFDIDQEAATGNQDSDSDDFVEDDEDAPLKGMVPFADMLNADADRNNARLFQEDDFLIMRSVSTIRAGEEILNDYGSLPRSDLLRMYGYITDNYAKYDVVEIEYETFLAAIKEQQLEVSNLSRKEVNEAVKKYDLYEAGYAIPRPTLNTKIEQVVSGQLHMLLRYLCGGKCKKIDWNNDEDISPFTFTVQEAGLISTALEKRLREYSTDIAEDQQSLAELDVIPVSGTTSGVSTLRYKQAIDVRKGEKEICHSIIDICRDFIKTQTAQITDGSTKQKRKGSPLTSPDKVVRKRSGGGL